MSLETPRATQTVAHIQKTHYPNDLLSRNPAPCASQVPQSVATEGHSRTSRARTNLLPFHPSRKLRAGFSAVMPGKQLMLNNLKTLTRGTPTAPPPCRFLSRTQSPKQYCSFTETE